MNLYEMLKARKVGWSNDFLTNIYAKAFGGSQPASEHEYTGAVPYTFTADGTPLIDWYIKGNMQQSGTPTPQNPITPSETGERTDNLYDASNPNIFNGYYNATTNALLTTENNAFIYIPLVQGRKYYVYGCKRYNASVTIRWATTSLTPVYNIPCIRTGQFAQTDIFTITAEANENYLAIFLCGDSDYSAYGTVEDAIATNGANLVIDNGYKIPILSANTTTPVYLGEVESTRRIKKQILTGTESVLYNGNEPSNRIMMVTLPTNEAGTNTPSNVICTHFETKNTVAQTSSGGIAMRSNGIDFVIGIGYDIINVDSGSTPVEVQNAFKTYLQQQYAAGTPVTVWYVLAESTTGIVNEPIRKIGTYADTLTATQAGVEIPTNNGSTTIDVETTVKPSEIYIKWKG